VEISGEYLFQIIGQLYVENTKIKDQRDALALAMRELHEQEAEEPNATTE
jgi:hypothetical protein|tara:strand:+ start:1074 stop:1223 length:150 start_codon:yes stop_codon:yes gene_type:complete